MHPRVKNLSEVMWFLRPPLRCDLVSLMRTDAGFLLKSGHLAAPVSFCCWQTAVRSRLHIKQMYGSMLEGCHGWDTQNHPRWEKRDCEDATNRVNFSENQLGKEISSNKPNLFFVFHMILFIHVDKLWALLQSLTHSLTPVLDTALYFRRSGS